MIRKKEEPAKKKNKIPPARKTRNRKNIETDGTQPLEQEDRAIAAPGDEKPGFPIVGIGASAGGLEAFEQFFAKIPPDSGMGFVLVPHLDPVHKSMMPELIQRTSRIPVSQAEEGTSVEPDHAYIIPPNKDMSILNGKLVLLHPAESRGFRHPIDFFFRALAQDQGPNAVCIILSGTGTEGTLGLKAVKGEGGLVMVQDPKEAKYDGMPASAVATGLVDDVLPAAQLPERLLGYLKYTSLKREPSLEARPEKGMADLKQQRIFSLIRAQTGHDFSLYKQNTILRRIQRRMALHQIDDISDYVVYLQNNKHEVDILFKEFLIRVTNFFRDEDAFEVLKQKVLPLITRDKSYDKPVRVWVPGCSTGEEAYSLAIILREYAQQTMSNFKIQIFATDIDSSAINIARAGTYMDNISVDVSPERLSRYFIKQGDSYKIKEELREMVVFSLHNVIKDAPFSKLDLISCRNLLIYLGSAVQKKILPLFHYALNPGGVLFLGSSENIGDSVDLFKVIDGKWKIFQTVKMKLIPPVIPGLRPNERFGRERGPDKIAAVKGTQAMKLDELTEKHLLDRVVFNSVPGRKGGKPGSTGGRTEKKIEDRISELEHELKSTREDLQSSIEELETSNEELMSTNEELQSSNEELQSTNEELETSREELQSVNEELMTVNAELQSKIDELTQANNDMKNLVSSTRIATIFLDNSLRIKSFTPEIVALFSLIGTDIGRPISDIVSKLDYPEFIPDIREVLTTSQLKEKTIRHPEGRWYLARVLPYRLNNEAVDGVVITFVDVTAHRLLGVLEPALAIAKGIIETLREPFLVLGPDLKVVSANKAFYQVFHVSHSETAGKFIYDLGNQQWDIPGLRELLEKILPESTELHDFEVEHNFPEIGLRKMLLNARRITREGAGTETILLGIEDVTGK